RTQDIVAMARTLRNGLLLSAPGVPGRFCLETKTQGSVLLGPAVRRLVAARMATRLEQGRPHLVRRNVPELPQPPSPREVLSEPGAGSHDRDDHERRPSERRM